MIGTNASGCGAESVVPVERPSRSCPIGSLRRRLSAWLSTTGLREHLRRCGRGAISTALQRPVALARPLNSAPMGGTSPTQRVVLADRQGSRRVLFADTHHRCLGSQRALPYSASRGKKSVNREALDELKEQIPLMGYLQAHDWQQVRPIGFGRFLGLCPLHADHKPSLVVDPQKESVPLLRLPSRRRRDSLR